MRSRLLAALLVSALLHVILALYLIRGVRPPETTRTERPVEMEISYQEPPQPAPIAPPTPPTPPAPKPAKPSAPKPPAPPSAATPKGEKDRPEAQAQAPSGAPPSREDTPAARPNLTPSPDALPFTVDPNAPTGRGHTLHPDDPKESPEVLAERERKRVEGRVSDLAEDQLATARAQRGLPHPYFGLLDEAMTQALGNAEGGTPQDFGVTSAAEAYAQNAAEAREAYGRSGNPGLPDPGLAPTPNENISRIASKDGTPGTPPEAQWIAAMQQANQVRDAIRSRGPMLTLELEVIQGPDGSVKQAKIVKRSRKRDFDRWVLKVVPESMSARGPIPPDALRNGKQELRSVWQVDGWLRSESSATDSLSPFGVPLSSLQEVGVPVDKLDRALGAGALRFEYKVRLLRAF